MLDAEDPPPWAYETVVIHDPDPAWRTRGEALTREVAALLGPVLLSDVVHVGSTSVPELPAKPIIDLMAIVGDPDAVCRQRERDLVAARWFLVPPELDQQPWRRFLVHPTADDLHRQAHLHLMSAGEPRFDDQIAFRNALCRCPELAGEYGRLKISLAGSTGDREEYSRAKSEFVRRVLAEEEGR